MRGNIYMPGYAPLRVRGRLNRRSERLGSWLVLGRTVLVQELAQDLVQPVAFGHDFARIPILGFVGSGADIKLERIGQIPGAPEVFFENLGADKYICLRIERDLLATQRLEFIGMITRDHLHET